MALDPATQAELAGLALEIANNPKTRKQFLKQVKEIRPGSVIPEIDQDSALEARVNEVTKPLLEKVNALEQANLQASFRGQRDQAATKFGLSAEDMDKVDKMITEKALPADYNWAGQLYKAQIEPAGGSNYGAGRDFGPMALPSQEGLMQDERAWSLKEAHQVIDELRARNNR